MLLPNIQLLLKLVNLAVAAPAPAAIRIAKTAIVPPADTRADVGAVLEVAFELGSFRFCL